MLVGLMQFGGQPPDRLVRVLGARARRRGMQSHRAPAGAKGARLPLFDVAAVSRTAGFVSSVSSAEARGPGFRRGWLILVTGGNETLCRYGSANAEIPRQAARSTLTPRRSAASHKIR